MGDEDQENAACSQTNASCWLYIWGQHHEDILMMGWHPTRTPKDSSDSAVLKQEAAQLKRPRRQSVRAF